MNIKVTTAKIVTTKTLTTNLQLLPKSIVAIDVGDFLEPLLSFF
jgi:hypothetical protein